MRETVKKRGALTRASGIVRASRLEVILLLKNKVEFSLVFAVFLFGFLFYLWVFLRNQLVPMIDGPYYLIQVRSLLTTGELVYGDPPLAFILLSSTSLLLEDIALGVKVGVSFFSALSTIPAYFLMKRVGKGIFAGILAMLLIIFSPLYIRTLTDFMKNAIGVCWLLAFVYYLHDLAFSGLKKSSLALAVFFLILTGLTHILDFGIALLFIIFYTFVALIFEVNRRSFLKAVGILLLAICVFLLIASVFFGSLFTDFTKAFSFVNEILLFQGREAQTPITSNPIQGIKPKPLRGDMDVFSLSLVGGWEVIALILFAGAFSSIFAWRKREKEALLLLAVVTAVGLVISFPLMPSDLLGRFLLMMVVPTAIVLSYSISKIWNLEGKDLKFVALALVVASLIFFVGQSFRTIAVINPSVSNVGYLDLTDMKDRIDSDSVIVAPRGQGLGYWIEYVEDVDVLGIDDLSLDLWQSYSHVLGVFPKNRIPSIPHQTIFVGRVYILVEVKQLAEHVSVS
jgi:4-amino-4-deoxy-L-arabinose transferase-like glycosyltransferase